MWRADSLEKALMLGKTEGRRRGRQRMRWVGWHHWLNGHEFEQTLGDGGGQGNLACYCPRGHKELATTEQQYSTKKKEDSNKILKWGNFLVVQWLGLTAFTAVAWIQFLVGELRSHRPYNVANSPIPTEIQRTIRDYYAQLSIYANKLGNLEKNEWIPRKKTLKRTENLNRPITGIPLRFFFFFYL